MQPQKTVENVLQFATFFLAITISRCHYSADYVVFAYSGTIIGKLDNAIKKLSKWVPLKVNRVGGKT